ncbi:zinc finger C2HC domain-containing protein 1A-like isoform X2 [Melanaphis sacchari]|uniref:zinc finger C2HC domain-containing protein 1A-like isoform X2 n=1 Tax=Melanaphis sacchari TaxID=742174 RepID=UPI000DC13A61|nr:zinc finger C2HC domain-containing protein 1A-like isoform X2 [Melanaphis sacchari]
MDQTCYNEEFPKENEIIELLPCIICNRSFRPNLLQRHTTICQKNAKKRKVPFDSSKQRREGTEMAAYLPHMKKTQDAYIGIEKSKKNWKAKHEELVRAVKAARGEKVDDKPVPTKPIDSEECPHCARNFGPKSYDRHVEFCREKAQRISTAPVISQVAKERLEARIKYRAPPLKSQRTVTKEKYSPKTKNLTQDVSSVPIKVIQPLKTIKKRIPPNRNVSNIPRQMSTVVKKKDQTSKSLYGDRNAIYLPQKPDTKNELAMKKSESAYILGSKNHIKQEINKMVNNFDKKNISKSQPHLDIYDPFKSAEQQMKELDLDINIIDIGLKNPLKCVQTDNIENLQMSPTSAFVKYSPVSSLVVSPDNIENTFPNDFHSDTNLNNHPLHNLSNLSLCSIVSIESADFNNKIHSAVERDIDHLKSPTKRNINHNNKKHIAIENMLYGDNEKNKSNLTFDLAEQELLKSVSEFENLLKITDDDDIVSPSLNRTSALSMINGINSNSSADSAYGSLNRKSEQTTTDNYLQLLKTAKFCHECGFKYPIVDIKFCTECGMRRIVS